MNRNLNLAEQLIILGVNSKKLIHKKTYTAICGILELIELNKLTLDSKSKIQVLDPTATGIEYLDIVLEIVSSKKPKKFRSWVDFFYCKEKISKKVYETLLYNLEKDNLISIEKSPILSKQKVSVKKNLDINTLIPNLKKETTSMDLNLLFLLEITKLTKFYYPSYQQKALKEKLKNLHINESWKLFRDIREVITIYENLPPYASLF